VLHWVVSLTIKSIFPVLALSIFSSMLSVGIIAPILPIYADTLGATGLWIGVIFSGYAIARTFLLPFIGRLSDRRGRKLILSAGLFASALISFAYVLADNVASLFVIRLLQGAAICTVQPISQAYVGDIAPQGEEGKWMGYVNAMFFIGWGFGPLLGGVITDYVGMDAAFYTMGGLNILAFLGVVLFLPEIVPRREMSAPSSSFREVASSNVMRGLFSFQMGTSSHRGIVQTFMPIFAGLTIGLSSTLIGILLSTLVIGAALLQLFSGRLADRFNRRVIVILGSLCILVSMLLVPQAGGFWLLFVFLAIAIIGDATALPSASVMGVEEGRKYGMGMAMAMFNTGMGVGTAIGPILAGLAADTFGVHFAFYTAAAIVLIGIILFSLFTRLGSATKT
jgi:DHA1 family multidrug resistance protein-like MFS transporter